MNGGPTPPEASAAKVYRRLLSYARHEMPQLGRIDEGLWLAQAFGGHGVAPTTLLITSVTCGLPVTVTVATGCDAWFRREASVLPVPLL